MSRKKLPPAAQVQRAGRTRSKKSSKGSGLLATLAGPVGLVALGLGVIIAAGYWAQHMPSQETPVPPAAQTDSAQGEAPKPSPQPQTTQPAPGPKPEPKPEPQAPKPDSPQAIQKARAHIDRSAGAAGTMLLTVYYVDGLKNGDTLQPVQIRLPQTTGLIKAAAEQVVNAPADLKLYSSVPAGTKVKSVDLKAGGVAVIDLSGEAGQVQGTAAAENMKASFVYSLTELPNVKAVQLWVNGRPAMLHGIEWSKPLGREDVRNLFKVEPVIKFSAR